LLFWFMTSRAPPPVRPMSDFRMSPIFSFLFLT
jgi:hypothetical protein